MINGSRGIGDVNPAHELPAAAKRSTHSKFERSEHAGQRASPFAQHHAEAKANNTNPRLDGRLRCGLPITTQLRQKARSPRRRFIQLTLAPIAIHANGRRTHQRPRRVFQRGERFAEKCGAVDTTSIKDVFAGAGPSTFGEIRPGQMNRGGDAFQRKALEGPIARHGADVERAGALSRHPV